MRLRRPKLPSDTPPNAGWPGVPAEEAARQAMDKLGLTGTLTLRHFGSNATYHLRRPHGDLALRVTDPKRPAISAAEEVLIARQFDRIGMPVTRPGGVSTNPVTVEHTVVTIWEWYEWDRPVLCSPQRMGELLRDFHKAGEIITDQVPLEELPSYDPVKNVADRIDDLEKEDFDGADRQVLEILRERLTRAQEQVAPIIERSNSVIHADWTQWNVMGGYKSRFGRAKDFIASDFEESGIGPKAWDLVPLLMETRRFGRPIHEWEAMCDAYGATENLISEAYQLLEVRELSNLSWAMKVRHESPLHEKEARRRIRSLFDADDTTRWEHSHPVSNHGIAESH